MTSSKIGKYPHQLLMKVPFDLNILARRKNLDVSYEELNEKTLQTGTVLFTNISGDSQILPTRKARFVKINFVKLLLLQNSK